MNKTEIMVYGKNDDILETTTGLFKDHAEWVLTEAHSDEEAIEKFHRQNFEVVIFTNAVSIEEERKLSKIFTIQNPDFVIIKHIGKDKTLLIAEITNALDKSRKLRKPVISLVDDALINAGLNIIIE